MLNELQSNFGSFQLVIPMLIFINIYFLKSIIIHLGQRSGKTSNILKHCKIIQFKFLQILNVIHVTAA